MTETVTADPPRFLWLKRGTLIGLSMIVALAVLRWWWGWEAQRRLDAFVAAMHARGEPVLPEDFHTLPPPANDNAAPTLLQAGAAVFWPLNVDGDPDDFDDADLLWRVGQQNIRARQLARAARSQPNAYWGAHPGNPLIANTARPFNTVRSLANLLAYSAKGESAHGNDHEAAELVRDLLREVRALDNWNDDLSSHLVALGIDAMGTNAAIRLSRSCRLSSESGQDKKPFKQPASPDQIRAIVADLLDERDVIHGAQQSMYSEMSAILEAGPMIVQRNAWNGNSEIDQTIGWIAEPMFVIDGVSGAACRRAFADAVCLPNFPSAIAWVRPFQRDYSNLTELEHWTSMVSRFLRFSNRQLEYHFRALTDRRAAATALAIRLYRAEHRGALPKMLADLTPQYLPSPLVDPMGSDGGGFGYKPNDDPPILYSVGLNGTDDGGSRRLMNPKDVQFERWRALDAIYPLDDASSDLPGNAQNHQ